MKKKKVSLFVSDLSQNPIVRAYPIAKAIEKLGFDVEILGFTINSDKIYEPYKNEFEYKTINTYLDIRWFIRNSFKLSRMAEGDIVYAFKPLWSTLFPALLFSKFGLKKRLILDAEDNELWEINIKNGFKNIFKSPWYPYNPIFNKILHPLTWLIKRKTIVCKSLQKRYGGQIVLHGPSAEKFSPEKFDTVENLREKYKLPINKKLVFFGGKPVFYNGVKNITNALKYKEAENWDFVIAGNPDYEDFRYAKSELKKRCHLLGIIPNSNMPEILKMVDVVPIIQTKNPATEMQIPAKLLEAMSMGKIIISTNVTDIPEILGNNTNIKRGIIVKSDYQLACELKNIEDNKYNLIEIGENARKYFVENSSIEVIAERIENLLK